MRISQLATPIDLSFQLRREVYGLLGMPIDVVDMAALLRQIEKAISDAAPFLLSTANLNFLMMSKEDTENFATSLLLSDLCTADGMPIVWLGRLLGIPIKHRIAGADIFERLKSKKIAGNQLKVFLFGGEEGIAETLVESSMPNLG